MPAPPAGIPSRPPLLAWEYDSSTSSRAGKQETRLDAGRSRHLSQRCERGFTPAALRASQRLAAHAASTPGPLCPSAVPQLSLGF